MQTNKIYMQAQLAYSDEYLLKAYYVSRTEKHFHVWSMKA